MVGSGVSGISKPVKDTKGKRFGSAANATENSGMSPDPEFDDFDAWSDDPGKEFVTTTFDTPQGLQRRTVPAKAPAAQGGKSNKYGGKCAKCGVWIGAGQGLLGERINGRWSVLHVECPARVVSKRSTAKSDAPEGFHLLDGEIYKVQIAVHGSGRPYAKHLAVSVVGGASKGKWEYAPGLTRNLNGDTLLTKDQAQEYGKLYGVCCICGATLTNETSIEAGIGPVCAGREW